MRSDSTHDKSLAGRERPLVSVVIPALNASRFIAETIKSVITQSYQELEIIVVDDGSTDDTAAIVLGFANYDPRVRYVHQENAGVAAARNRGIHLSKGEFIAPVDADDIWYSDKIGAQVQVFEGVDQSIALVYTWSALIDENSVLTGGHSKSTIEGDVFEDMLFGNIIGNASVPLIRRECLDKVGCYGEEFFARNAQGCEDGDLYLRISEKYKFAVIRRILVGYRDSPRGMSKQHQCMHRSNDFRIERLKERQPGIPRKIYRSAEAFFFIYLSRMAYGNGEVLASFRYLSRSVICEPAFLCCSEFWRTARTRFVGLVMGSLPKGISGKLRRKNHSESVRRVSHVEELQERAEESLMDSPSALVRVKQRRIHLLRQFRLERDLKVACTGTQVS